MTQLRDLLDEVAESRVPDGLARRAVADADAATASTIHRGWSRGLCCGSRVGLRRGR